jgi:peptidoglycan/xylan/chitin deacetylase (PgdA/CDA1 family)
MARVPVLLYHHVRPEAGSSMNVPPEVFQRQIEQLAAGGWRTMSLADLVQGVQPTRRSIVITFDDGYQDFADTAWPILQSHGMKAVCFVVPTQVGGENLWDGGGTPLMSVQTLARLAHEGVELGLHGWTHEDWNEMPEDTVRDLLSRGERWFADHDLPLTPAFAYPGGKFPRRQPHQDGLARAFEASSMLGAFRIGSATTRVPIKHPWAMCRVPIEGRDGPLKLAVKLRFGRIRF